MEIKNNVRYVAQHIAYITEDALQLGLTFQEETLTEVALYTMLKRQIGKNYLRINSHNKPQESKTGVDFEWWIYFKHTNEWVPLFFQAKRYFHKLKGVNLIYPQPSRKKNNPFQQSSKLYRHAKKFGGVPLYCFYNPLSQINSPEYGWTYMLGSEARKLVVPARRKKQTKLIVDSTSCEPLYTLFEHYLEHTLGADCKITVPEEFLSNLFVLSRSNSDSWGYWEPLDKYIHRDPPTYIKMIHENNHSSERRYQGSEFPSHPVLIIEIEGSF